MGRASNLDKLLLLAAMIVCCECYDKILRRSRQAKEVIDNLILRCEVPVAGVGTHEQISFREGVFGRCRGDKWKIM